MKALLTAMVLINLPVIAMANNKVRNGDFKAGNVGFTSTLRYVAPLHNALTHSGTYTIETNPHKLGGYLPNITDLPYGHEKGMGPYLIANGSRTKNAVVWREDNIKFVAGTEYVFENFFATLSDTARPVFEAYYNLSDGEGDQFLGQWNAENAVGIWQGMEARFVPTGKKLTITIHDLTGANAGNDFALGAIEVISAAEWAKGQPHGTAQAAMFLRATSVGAVPEPATWAMILFGFVAVGGAMRKQQSVAA